MTAEQDTQEEGGPAEGAEATRQSPHLFAYSRYVHVGTGAEECEHREDGECKDGGHFHARVCMPNSIQHKDILEKARAARSRKKRAMRDPATDSYASLEADLDDLLIGGEAERLRDEIANREIRKENVKRIGDVQESDERFENYWQDREEWERLSAMPEDERPKEEYEQLGKLMADFEEAVEQRKREDHDVQMAALRAMTDEQFREKLRSVRIDGEGADAHLAAYYLWMGFASTKRVSSTTPVRHFAKLDEYREAPPEVVDAIDATIRDLESRQQRGEAAGN